MSVYSFRRLVTGYLPLTYVDESQCELWRSLSEPSRLLESWPDVSVRYLRPEEDDFDRAPGEGRSKDTDVPWLMGTLGLVLSERFTERMGDMLVKYGELLPLRGEGVNLYLYHVMNCIDALDEAASECKRFDDGSVMRVIKHALRSEVVSGNEVFTMPAPSPYDVFVTDAFVDRVRRESLRGCDFKLVWSSDSSSDVT